MKNLLNIAINASIEAGQAILDIYNTEFEVAYKQDQSPLTLADQQAHDIIEGHLKETAIPILSEEGRDISFSERKQWDKLWIVDPLDGTKEFVNRNDEFTVNIALIEKGKPILGVIYAPVLDILYYGYSDGAFRLLKASQTVTANHENAKKLPIDNDSNYYSIVASRSHQNQETQDFIKELEQDNPNTRIISKGSSLKLCMIAEGVADIYPRFAPTMEWDIAAGHAIVKASGGSVQLASDPPKELCYNKVDLLNPWFVARRR